MYYSCKAELDAVLAENIRKDQFIAKLNQRIQQLIKATKSARENAKEAHKHVLKVEKDEELETMKLKVATKDVHEQLQKKDIGWKEETVKRMNEV